MNTFLTDLAVESGVIEEHAGSPEEITINTMDTETELEEVIEKLAADVEKASDQNKGTDQLVKTMVSLEAKLTMLQGMRETGESLNATAAKMYSSAIATSMEARGFPLKLYGDVVSEMDHSFESHQAYDYSTEAEAKTEGLLTRIKAMLKKALDGFINFWKDMASRVGTMGKTVTGLGETLITKSGTLGGKAPGDGKISASGLAGVVSGPSKVITDLTAATSKLNANEKKLAEALKMIGDATLSKSDPSETNRESGRLLASIDAVITLPSGFTLEYSEADGSKLEVKGGDKPEVKEVAILSQPEIKKLGTDLLALGKALTISDSDQRSLIGVIESSTNKMIAKLEKDDKATGSGVMKDFNTGVKMIRSGRAVFNKHATNVAKQAYRYASQSINRHSAA